MRWLDRLLGHKLLTALEDRLLRELQQRLTPDAARLMGEQMRSINLAQRHSGGREVCFYPMRRGRPERDDALRFPARQPELKLATIHFQVPQHGHFTAEFHLVDGYSFSIEFTPSPTQIKDKDADVLIQRVDVHNDPMVSSGTTKVEQVQEIEAQLPEDYVESSESKEAWGVGGVRVLSLEGVYSVVLDDTSYYVLAQLEDVGVLGVRKHSHDGMIYFLPFDGTPRSIGRSFREAVISSGNLVG